VVGGGPTGVELAGALGEIANYTLKHNFRHIDPASARVISPLGLQYPARSDQMGQGQRPRPDVVQQSTGSPNPQLFRRLNREFCACVPYRIESSN